MQNYIFLGTVEGEDKYALQIAQKLIESFNYFNRIHRYAIKQNSIHTFTYNKNCYEIIVSNNPYLPISLSLTVSIRLILKFIIVESVKKGQTGRFGLKSFSNSKPLLDVC